MARVFHPKYAEKWQKSYDIVAKLREAKAAKETAEVNVKGAMSLPEVIVSSVFPPAGVVLGLPEGGEKVLAAVPEAFLGSIIPVIPFITGRTPVEALLTSETGRQIDIVPDVVMPPEDKEKAKEMYTGLWQEGKPWVIGGGTSVFDVGGAAIHTVFPTIEFPDIAFPKLPGFPDFGGIGKTAIMAGAALAGVYLLGKMLGGKR